MKMTNLKKLVFSIAFVFLLTLSAAAQSSEPGMDSYTSIDYDETTNTVYAYSETDADYEVMGDYQASVYLSVKNDSGIIVASALATDTSGNGYAAVELSFAGAADTTYTATGQHRAIASLYDYDYDPPYQRIYYYDSWYFTPFEEQSILKPYGYLFASPGYAYYTRRTSRINLGTTYDSASTIPVPNRGQIQAQGKNPPVEKSRSWAQLNVPTKSEGLANIDSLWDSLTRSERKERGQAYTDAYRYIKNSPPEGRPFNGTGGKSFFDPQRTDPSARIDVVIIKGLAFEDDPKP